MKLSDLQERRAILVAEMRSITEKPAGNGGDLDDQQAQKFDSLKADLEKLERSIERQRAIDDAERRMQGQPIAGTDQRFEDACRGFSLRAAIAGAAGLNVEWGRERELGTELARRAGRQPQGIFVPMSVFHQPLEQRVITGAGEGANIIGTDLRGDQFIDALRAKMVVRRLGARVLGGLVGSVDIPKLLASPGSAWVADNGAITPSDPNLDKVSLTPKHAGVITEFSRNTLLQSSPDIEQLLRADFAQLLAQALDRVAINGGGSNEPDGVLQSGLDVTVSMTSTPTWEKVLQIIEKVEVENAEGTAWVTTPQVVRKLRSTAKVSSTDSVMIQEAPDMLAGYPLAATTNCPGDSTSSPLVPHNLIFGNWSDCLIGFWSELDILVNPYESTAYSKGNVQIRGMMTVDIGVRHAESFAACIDLAP